MIERRTWEEKNICRCQTGGRRTDRSCWNTVFETGKTGVENSLSLSPHLHAPLQATCAGACIHMPTCTHLSLVFFLHAYMLFGMACPFAFPQKGMLGLPFCSTFVPAILTPHSSHSTVSCTGCVSHEGRRRRICENGVISESDSMPLLHLGKYRSCLSHFQGRRQKSTIPATLWQHFEMRQAGRNDAQYTLSLSLCCRKRKKAFLRHQQRDFRLISGDTVKHGLGAAGGRGWSGMFQAVVAGGAGGGTDWASLHVWRKHAHTLLFFPAAACALSTCT